MSDKSKIEWTDASWNPIAAFRGDKRGWHCEMVSAGCTNCYAASLNHLRGTGLPYNVQSRDQVELRFVGLDQPLRWKRPRRIFVCSMTDLFAEFISDEWIAAVFGVMAASPQHTFLVLTKRAERMAKWFEWVSRFDRPDDGERRGGSAAFDVCCNAAARHEGGDIIPDIAKGRRWPLHNVHLGVSVENQATADERIPDLQRCPAAIHWISYEPALEATDFSRSRWMWPVCQSWPAGYPSPEAARAAGVALPPTQRQCLVSAHAASRFLKWIVVGGESGPGARPFDISWARSTIKACKAAGVACFVKQLGARPMMRAETREGLRAGDRPGLEWPEGTRFSTADEHMGTEWQGRWALLKDRKGSVLTEWPQDLRIREYPNGAM
jgi:protein gp37